MTACKDCRALGLENNRPATPPGPRCTTHHRARKAEVRLQAHGRSVGKYGITQAEYDALKASQGGRCFVCQRATGARKALAVDHDHDLGYGRHSVRALLCTTCNHVLLGRYDVAALQRAIEVLTDPPAQRFLAEVDRRRAQNGPETGSQ